jgi:hypothetical protein
MSEPHVIYTNSEISALTIVLEYYRSLGRIKNKMSVIWIPKSLDLSIECAIQKVCFPAVSETAETCGVFIQRDDSILTEDLLSKASAKGWFTVERYIDKIQKLHTDAGIFSLSRVFPELQAGVLITRDQGLADFAVRLSSRKNLFASNLLYITRWLSNRKALKPFHGSLTEFIRISEAVSGHYPQVHPWTKKAINKKFPRFTFS